jgi:hypothetical protein
MATAIRRASSIDPQACRAVARERFGLSRMTERYIALYRRLAAAGAPLRKGVA